MGDRWTSARLRLAPFVVAACGLASCGSRTGLDDSVRRTDGGAADAADVRTCPAPWVLFNYVAPHPGSPTNPLQIYALRADGTDGHVVALPRSDGQAFYPSTSPDGASLVYADGALSHLFVYRFADGTERTLATRGPTGFGSLSPDGRTAVYGNGNYLFVVGVDGVPPMRLLVDAASTPTGGAGYPTFLSDSQTVVFAEGGAVQSIRVDGSARRTLVTDRSGGTFLNPTLSPDRRQLAAVVSCDGATSELRVWSVASLPADCATGRVVTAVPSNVSYYVLAWGPTGLIAFGSGHDVMLVPAAGGTSTNLTATLTGREASATSPTWVEGCVQLP